MGGLILGRSPVLWYGFLAALLNAVVLAGLITVSTPELAAFDTVIALGLALLGNSSDPRTVPTFAPTITPPALVPVAAVPVAPTASESAAGSSSSSPSTSSSIPTSSSTPTDPSSSSGGPT